MRSLRTVPESTGGAGQGGLRFLDRLDDGVQERRQVIGLTAGDEVAVADHLGVDVAAAGVDDVVLDREEARRPPALERLRGAKHPRTMADGGDHLALLR